jgi:hypothetical protein
MPSAVTINIKAEYDPRVRSGTEFLGRLFDLSPEIRELFFSRFDVTDEGINPSIIKLVQLRALRANEVRLRLEPSDALLNFMAAVARYG